MVLAIKFEMKTNSGVTIFTPLFNSCVNIVTPLLNSGVTIFTQRLFTPRSWNNTIYTMYNIYMSTKSNETQKALKHKSSETQI